MSLPPSPYLWYLGQDFYWRKLERSLVHLTQIKLLDIIFEIGRAKGGGERGMVSKERSAS